MTWMQAISLGLEPFTWDFTHWYVEINGSLVEILD